MSSTDSEIVKRMSAEFSAETFSLDVVKKAAYRFSDRAAFDFNLKNGCIVVQIDLLSETPRAEGAALILDFRNEVLDQDLRESIAEETSAVRNAVLAYAFSRTGLQRD